ncbi:MAG: tRNA (adenosine(37)-N6)-threonylcarbamoyltransferase complex dimerization subunit type 1 TsaB [Clostridia bacterium]|nr:tRNA (adenosine(37)-N6)-threonylcarbamoyltransferase complex dimerization subunit type 1 TsaB [Clostridia bacterium]
MNYLLIDTACGTRGVIEYGGTVYYAENTVGSGSEALMPLIDGLLKKAGITLADLDILGACVGPGSFTGLRIGLATVKTVCYALGKRCFAVNNLRLYSYNNNGGKTIAIADAGNKVCYIAAYDGDEEISPPACVTLDDAKAFVAAHSDFAVSTDTKLASVFGGKAGAGERELVLAAHKAFGNGIDQKDLLPLYIRKAQPERGAGDL